MLNKKGIDKIYNTLVDSVADPPEPEISEEVYKYDKHNYILRKQKEWIELIENNSERFIIGTGQQVDFHIYEPQVVLINRAFSRIK